MFGIQTLDNADYFERTLTQLPCTERKQKFYKKWLLAFWESQVCYYHVSTENAENEMGVKEKKSTVSFMNIWEWCT